MSKETVAALGITGHRLDKLGGYDEAAPFYSVFRDALYQRLLDYIREGYERFIQGGAIGTDMISAEIIIDLKQHHDIHLVTAVPFIGQERKWPPRQQERYRKILESSDDVVVVNPGGYAPDKMQIRNEWICRQSTRILAVWNGSHSGTGNTVHKAKQLGVPCDVFDPMTISAGTERRTR